MHQNLFFWPKALQPTCLIMIKQSSILKWTHNNRQNHKGGGRDWIHPPDTLQRGHIAYLVKFLGNTEVDQAKGIDVVKEGIRKLKFTSQIKKSEGTKPPKVELTISIDGVAIQEPKTKRILHQYPLHRISYCADDKAEKKFFSFIAKESESDKHMCFVFVSDKLAEEITLTIGQAFDLAYRRFLETSGRDLEMRKQLMILQKKIQSLEDENRDLKRQLQDLERINNKPEQADGYKQDNGKLPGTNQLNGNARQENHSHFTDGIPKPSSTNSGSSRPAPARAQSKDVPLSPSQELFNEFGTTLPIVGTKLENLTLDEFEDFNPRASNDNFSNSSTVNGAMTPAPYIRPPPSLTNGNIFAQTPSHNTFATMPTQPTQQPHPANNLEKDLFGAEPFTAFVSKPTSLEQQQQQPSAGGTTEDPFGMGDFGQVPSHLGAQELESAIGDLDKRLSEMRDGFSRGISFGNDDFSLESLDPLCAHKPPA